MAGRLTLAFLLLVLMCQPSQGRRVDCTKFVFAPICRGVAAKRGMTSYFTEDLPPANRLSKMVDVDEAALVAPPGDVLASRRHALHGGKRYRPAAPVDPDLLRMRWGALRAALRRRVDEGDQQDQEDQEDQQALDQEARDKEAGEDVDYSADRLQGGSRFSYRQVRADRLF